MAIKANRFEVITQPAINPNQLFNAWTNHGHKPGFGEDSDPFILCTSDKRKGILGTFDGMGGAGSTLVTLPDGKVRTEAYVASRIIRNKILEYCKTDDAVKYSSRIDKEHLKEHIIAALNEKREELGIKTSRIRSSMLKTLPSTMAVVSWEIRNNGIEINNFWAGDTRNYILCESGLFQMTKDDIRGDGDAMYSLHNDPPMSNSISQSHNFHINQNTIFSSGPVIIISCTDGCYGYVKSPMHFEYMLIHTLLESDDVTEWAARISEFLEPISGDDFSYAISMIGRRFGAWKLRMHRRYDKLVKTFITPCEKLYETENYSTDEELEIWEKYKIEYNSLIDIEE